MLDVVNSLLYLSESGEGSIPKKPVTPINGKVAEKLPAQYVNDIISNKKCKNNGKI
jgi:hypothetical protein